MDSRIKEVNRKYFFYFVKGCLDQLDHLETIFKGFSKEERIKIFYETVTEQIKRLE